MLQNDFLNFARNLSNIFLGISCVFLQNLTPFFLPPTNFNSETDKHERYIFVRLDNIWIDYKRKKLVNLLWKITYFEKSNHTHKFPPLFLTRIFTKHKSWISFFTLEIQTKDGKQDEAQEFRGWNEEFGGRGASLVKAQYKRTRWKAQRKDVITWREAVWAEYVRRGEWEHSRLKGRDRKL